MDISPEAIKTAIEQMHSCQVTHLTTNNVDSLRWGRMDVHTARLRDHSGSAAHAFAWTLDSDEHLYSTLQNGRVQRAEQVALLPLASGLGEFSKILLNDLRPNVPATPTRILLVEDEASLRMFAKEVLKYQGHQVTAHEDAESGLKALEQEQFDVLLTDCRLPGMQGNELIARVRLEYPDLPAIGMSGEHFKGKSMLDAGAITFLEKPLALEPLWKAVEDAHSLRKAALC